MMTGLMHEKEFSRKAFVKGGGALIVGVTALSAFAGKASAANGLTPFASRGPSDYLPDINAVDTWITITPQNTCIITHGETELGHGTPTGITMLTRGRAEHGLLADGLRAPRVVAERHGRRQR